MAHLFISAIVNEIIHAENRLFVASSTHSFHCLDSDDGSLIWSTASGPSVYLTSAQYFAEEDVVYTIQVSGGVRHLFQILVDCFILMIVVVVVVVQAFDWENCEIEWIDRRYELAF
mmetsp:Transcript_6648/g.9563  ORF Transcript_6648/g.9563 Transcript_6648/m.9563 type:complete len:116 (-) Transcript_6648:44-391(-)